MKNTKVINCKWFRSSGNVFGGCKHPEATSACLYQYMQECDISERIVRKQKVIPDFVDIQSVPGKYSVTFYPATVKYFIKADYGHFENAYPEIQDLSDQERDDFINNKMEEWSGSINSPNKSLIVIPLTFEIFELNVENGAQIKVIIKDR